MQQEDQSASFKQQIETLFGQWQTHRPERPINALYLIWAKPWMGVASSTFIDHMLGLAGFSNVVDSHTIDILYWTKPTLQLLHPDVVLMSSEPFPFKQDHFQQMEKLFPNGQDTSMWMESCFHGMAVVCSVSPGYFQDLINEIGMN